jgi:dTDP-4-dehydrorhamnose reductase
MRVVITGAGGQLGRALSRRAVGHDVVSLVRADADVGAAAVTDVIARLAPEVVVNTAAFTDVDGCEADPDMAFRVNALGARNVALGAARAGAAVVHMSTEYVFDGRKDVAYWEFDPPAPASVYGASKLAGEQLVWQVCDRVYVVRTSWLYGLGGTNFITKILALAAERPELAVVDNEVGSPTFCDDLADAILALAATGLYGPYHLVNEGACSRFDLARAVLDRAGRADYRLTPTDHYARPARPPAYAPLRNFAAAGLGIRLAPWEDALDRYFALGGPRGP